MKYSKYGKGGPLQAPAKEHRITFPMLVLALIAALVLGAAGWQVSQSGGDGKIADKAAVATDIQRPDGTVVSRNATVAAGVQVDEPSVDLGRQPLNTRVERTFTLRNVGSTAVSLGRPNIEVLEGCCPSDPILNTNRIEPGKEVPFVFSLPMGMHKGMDGPHLFRLTVPVKNDNGETGNVEIYVKADFG